MIQQKSRITLILLKMQYEDWIRWSLTKDMIMKVGVLKTNSCRSLVSGYIVTKMNILHQYSNPHRYLKGKKKCSNPTIGGFMNKPQTVAWFINYFALEKA